MEEKPNITVVLSWGEVLGMVAMSEFHNKLKAQWGFDKSEIALHFEEGDKEGIEIRFFEKENDNADKNA